MSLAATSPVEIDSREEMACLVVSHATKDTSGVEGGIAWVTFVGMWVAMPLLLVVAVGAALRSLRRPAG